MAGENIEDKIISDVESNTGDNFSPEPNGGGNDGGQSSAEPTTSAEPKRPEQSDARTRDNRNNRQEPTRKDPAKDQGKDQQLRPDGKGNLVDREGNIVAAKGPERRLQVQNERLKQNAQNMTAEIAQLRQQLQDNDALRGMPQQFGLNQQDMRDAMNIAGQMKRDPIKGARMALEYALSQGADLNQIVQGEGLQNISLGAQRRMMEEFHQRTAGPQEQQRRHQEVLQRAQQNSQRFAAEYSEFEEHFDDVARMIPEIMEKARNSGRQVDEYTAAEMGLQMLQNYAMKNGLDPRRSINDQIAEIAAQRNNPQQRRDVRQAQPRRQAPMPNGSRGVDRTPSRSGSLPSNATSDAIVRQAMAEAGYQF